MIYPLYSGNVKKTDLLPPLQEKRSVKNSEKWQKAVMDAFEQIGREQFFENAKYWDIYRMLEGKMSYQELREAIPSFKNLNGLLDDAEIPANLKHWDLIGPAERDIVSKFIDAMDKFFITDMGEVAESEYLRYFNDKLMTDINKRLELEMKLRLAERGFNLDNAQKFQNEQEQQAYMQQLEAEKQKLTPEEKPLYDKPRFKTAGTKFAENIMEMDQERFKMKNMEKTELKHMLRTGRWFREYKVGLDYYKPITWDPRNVFISKEVDSKYPQDNAYTGRVHFMSPQEVIRKYHEYLTNDNKKELLGGNEDWKNFAGFSSMNANISPETIEAWNEPKWIPFDGYYEYNALLNMQDQHGVPMGDYSFFDENNEPQTRNRYLPKYHTGANSSNLSMYASVLRSDFNHRSDLCQVTEVYFIAWDYWGILTYRTETGLLTSVDITEDILPEFIKENNIKQNFKSTLADEFNVSKELRDEDENTIKWFTRPVCYEGVKITNTSLSKDLYLYCRPMKHQIKGDSDFDVKLPVVGYIGEPAFDKCLPYQHAYNMCMNQIFQMLEKEIGMFFLLDIAFIPSEFSGAGDAQEALIELREIARDFGIMPVATSGDAQRTQTHFNQFSTQNLSYAPQIDTRMKVAEMFKAKFYEAIGSNPQMAMQPTKYETAKGVEIGNKASYSYLSEIFQDFNDARKDAWEVHLSVSQYAHSDNKEHNLNYTKSDGSQAFVRIYDPNLPLRRFGLIPTTDSKKRGEVADYKQWLIQTNTIGTDPLEVAKLMFSDASLELIEIAKQAVEKRQQAEEQRYQRDLNFEKEKAQIEEQSKIADHQRQVERDRANNETKILVAGQNARGRAMDNYEDAKVSATEIQKAEDRALQQTKIQSAENMKQMDTEVKRDLNDKTFQLKMEELKLKARELNQKERFKETDRYIAQINKN